MHETDIFVFDLNGLIVDDEPLQLKSSNIALAKAGFGIVISEQQWVEQCVGQKPAEWLIKILHGQYPTNKDIEAIISYRDQVYSDVVSRKARSIARKGVLELIANIVHRPEKQLALATSTTRCGTETILGEQNLNILSSFDFVICGDQVQQAKPCPEIYLKVRAHFGQNSRYLVFEDSGAGVVAATSAGMKCIAVPNRYTLYHDFSKAVAIIDSLSNDAQSVDFCGKREL